ncbi:MAG: carboxypeptidase-like regulatory domain-containing protein [Lysobacterales bacterium]
MRFTSRLSLLIALAPGFASAAQTERLEDYQRALADLQHVPETHPRVAATDPAARVMHWRELERQLGELGVPELQPKVHQLAVQDASPLGRTHPLAGEETDWRVSVNADIAGTCQTALDLWPGSSVELIADQVGGPFESWVRVHQKAAPQLLSTLGSRVDTSIEVWRDCNQVGNTALVSNDDYDGLQALVRLPVDPDRHSLVARIKAIGSDPVVRAALVNGGNLISGTVTVPDVWPLGLRVEAFAVNGGSLGSTLVNPTDGYYELPVPGQAFVVRTTQATVAEGGLVMELYPDLQCHYSYGAFGSCFDAEQAQVFQPSMSYTNIDFDLDVGGTLVGSVFSSVTGEPVIYANVRLQLPDESIFISDQTDVGGRYTMRGLPTHDFAVEADNHVHRQLFDGIDCGTAQCDLNLATYVPIAPGSTSRADFQLPSGSTVVLYVPGFPTGLGTSVSASLTREDGSYIGSVNTYSNVSGVAILPLGNPGVPFRISVQAGHMMSQVFPDVLCAAEHDCRPELPLGQLINPPSQGQLELTMQPTPLPLLRGRVIDSATGLPITGVAIRAAPAPLTSIGPGGGTTATGDFAFEAYPGSYRVHAASGSHIDVIYPDIPCDLNGLLLPCSGGTEVNVGLAGNQPIEIGMMRSARIRGAVLIDGEAASSSDFRVHLLDQNGLSIKTRSLADWGRMDFPDIVPGEYHVGISAAFDDAFPGLWQDIHCPLPTPGGDPFEFCLEPGNLLVLASGSDVTNIDFDLHSADGHWVRVIRADNGEPLPNVTLDSWRPNGDYLTSVSTNLSGWARAQGHDFSGIAEPFLLSTFNNQGFIDEVYRDRPCPNGPAIFDQCSLVGAEILPARPESPDAEPLVITLSLPDSETIWSNGFE